MRIEGKWHVPAGRLIDWPARRSAMMSVTSHLSLDLPSAIPFEYEDMKI